MARPSKYKEEYNEQAYKLSLLGATDKDMADFFEVTESTLNLWKENKEGFSESLKRGKQLADANVASKLYHRAIGYEHKEIITASFQGEITDMREVVKHYAPDTTAAIFWLKNRKPAEWRDKHEIESRSEVVNKHEYHIEQTINSDPESAELLKQLYKRSNLTTMGDPSKA